MITDEGTDHVLVILARELARPTHDATPAAVALSPAPLPENATPAQKLLATRPHLPPVKKR